MPEMITDNGTDGPVLADHACIGRTVLNETVVVPGDATDGVEALDRSLDLDIGDQPQVGTHKPTETIVFFLRCIAGGEIFQRQIQDRRRGVQGTENTGDHLIGGKLDISDGKSVAVECGVEIVDDRKCRTVAQLMEIDIIAQGVVIKGVGWFVSDSYELLGRANGVGIGEQTAPPAEGLGEWIAGKGLALPAFTDSRGAFVSTDSAMGWIVGDRNAPVVTHGETVVASNLAASGFADGVAMRRSLTDIVAHATVFRVVGGGDAQSFPIGGALTKLVARWALPVGIRGD